MMMIVANKLRINRITQGNYFDSWRSMKGVPGSIAIKFREVIKHAATMGATGPRICNVQKFSAPKVP